MSDLIFCTHCGLTIYESENTCPHCKNVAPQKEISGSKVLALSILMGLSVSCLGEEMISETPEPEMTQQTDESQIASKNKEESNDGEKSSEVNETNKNIEITKLVVGSNDAKKLNNSMKNKPEPPMAAAYGAPAMDMSVVPTQWSMSSIKIAIANEKEKAKIRRELQQLLQTCDVSIFSEGNSLKITLELTAGKIDTPKLTSPSLSPIQQECITRAFAKKQLPTSVTGSISFVLRAKN